jgi:RNA polymerase sigma-70 factor
MAQKISSQPVRVLPARFAALIRELHGNARCSQWGLSLESFAEALGRSASWHFGAKETSDAAVEGYLRSLHVEDLALACACSEGNEQAWEFFVAHYRPALRVAAGSMLRGSGMAGQEQALELADSLYAELYGVRSGQDGRRKSLFEYFHGRSKLSTWLRAILAQRHVDQVRASARTVSLDPEKGSDLPREATYGADPPEHDPKRAAYLVRIDRALFSAFADLTARERMILACYYVDQLTLAEIGRMVREHESTISRQLERIRQALRERVTCELQRGKPARDGLPAEPALDEAQVELAFEYALEDWAFDLPRALAEARTRADLSEK